MTTPLRRRGFGVRGPQALPPSSALSKFKME
uniref:Catestatin choromogranin A n=1 Tax=Siphoviridae sp. ctEBu1 TaxID=2825393 RepID=A0A8S5QGD2_9CAUD|nr:MAG TPA: catestatin choromogranin A [Siphoviridae sp. ctEBu1]